MTYEETKESVEKRVETIEKRINKHIALLKNSSKAALFMNVGEPMDANLKLELLLDNQNELQIRDKSILRMESITQSYFMYDSTQFKKVKTIDRLLKTNSEYRL